MKQHSAGPKTAFVVVYCPLNSPVRLHNSIVNLIEDASSQHNEVVVAGDFNIDLFKNTDDKLSKAFRDAGFTQLVKDATGVSDGTETLIDHVYTTHSDRIINIKVPIYGLTDHYPVCFTHEASRANRRKNCHESITYRNYNNSMNLNF